MRNVEVVGSDHARFEDAIHRLARVGDDLRVPPGPHSAPVGDAFLDALALAVAALGLTLKPSMAEQPDMDLAARLAAHGHRSGFRVRRVALRGRWWLNSNLPLIALESESGAVVALCPDAHGYVLRRAGERDVRVNAGLAKKISETAFGLYDSLPEKPNAGILLRLAIRDAGGDFGRILAAALGAAALSLVVPTVFGSAVAVAIPEGRLPLLFELTLMLVASVIASSLLAVFKSLAIARLAGRADLRLQAAVWDRVLRMRPRFLRQWTTGDLALRLLGVDAIRRIASSTLLGAVLSGVFGTLNLIVMAVISGPLTFWALIYAAVVGALYAALAIAQVRLQRISFELAGQIQSVFVQFLGAIPKLRVDGAERRAFSRWADLYAEQRGAEARSALYLSASVTLQSAMLPLATLAVFVALANNQEVLPPAEFVAFNTAFGQLLASVVSLFASVTQCLRVVPLWERLQPIMNARIEEASGRHDPGELDGSLAVRNLVFRYEPQGQPILDGVSFDVQPGQFVAIVGRSGCGKSTLLRLLLGLEEPEQGAVFYNGRDLSRLDLYRVRQQIGTVLQEPGLVPGSILQVVAGGRQFTQEDVTRALDMAGLADDIARLPMGLQTMVTEGGSTFSGGQRQRMMIARALIAKPKLVLFDEATSALDNRTQKVVTDALRQLSATRVVVAHRLSTIIDADVIVVLERGRIAEMGRYSELMAKNGLFRELAERQIA